jgi:hypothetical protein
MQSFLRRSHQIGALCVINLLCGYIRAMRVKDSFKIPCLQLAVAMILLRHLESVRLKYQSGFDKGWRYYP